MLVIFDCDGVLVDTESIANTRMAEWITAAGLPIAMEESRRRFWSEGENRWIRLRVSNAGLRTIDKKGIDVVVAELRARGEKL